jgi:threonine dehydrogenase-like Zn-dependent dehydrogenase
LRVSRAAIFLAADPVIHIGLSNLVSNAAALAGATVIRSIHPRTGLVDGYSAPTLLNLIRTGQLDVGRFVTHRFALDDFEEAYDTFSRANDTGALKVVVSRA